VFKLARNVVTNLFQSANLQQNFEICCFCAWSWLCYSKSRLRIHLHCGAWQDTLS